MGEVDEISDSSDRELGELLVKRGLITPSQFLEVVQQFESLKGTPEAPGLEDLLVKGGYIQDRAVLDDLKVETQAEACCMRCGKFFRIFFFNPSSPYVCKACGGKLRQGEPDVVLPKAGAADPSGETLLDMGQTPRSAGAARPAPEAPPEVAAAAQDPKHVFGKYVLIKELGRGGTSVVYKAWDTSLCQFVALKILRSEDQPEEINFEPSTEIHDFQREARLAARLRHPNIIRVYELGRVGDKNYITMELMEGPTLFELIHGGRQRSQESRFQQEPERLLTLVRDVALAVHYAHTQSPPVIHRDIKPQNVLTDQNGTPYVVDFGLAKETDLGKAETVTGVVKGTPSYMSPEQAEGKSKEVDPRTDVYGLGALLYEVLTGRPPFSGDNVRHVLNDIVNKIPGRPNDVLAREWQALHPSAQLPPRSTETSQHFKTARRTKGGPPVVSRRLETICLKALEKRQADRYATAKDFADDIDRYLQKQDIEAREPSVVRKALRRIRAHPITFGVMGALLLAGGVGLAVRVPRQEQRIVVGADQLVDIATEHLKDGDWPALRNDISSLRQLDPQNAALPRLEAAAAEHEAQIARRRREWDERVARLKPESLRKGVDDLRPLYRDAGELKAAFWDKLDRVLTDFEAEVTSGARELAAPGPHPGWLDEPVRQAALSRRRLIADLASLGGDPDYPFQPDPGLAALAQSLDRLLNYKGVWELRVNVAPYAEVVVRHQGKEVVRDVTPLGLPGLEVLDGYTVELYWPSRAAPKQKSTRDVNGLRNGVTVVLDGNVDQPDLRKTP